MTATATPAASRVTATANPAAATPIGRTTTGDNGGGRQPAAVKAARVVAAATKINPAKVVTATTMGPSGYREEFGVLTDEQIVRAVRASFEPGPFTLTDEQIVGAIGWALTVGTAVTRVAAFLTAQISAGGLRPDEPGEEGEPPAPAPAPAPSAGVAESAA
jgi:hypothetical protein